MIKILNQLYSVKILANMEILILIILDPIDTGEIIKNLFPLTRTGLNMGAIIMWAYVKI